MEVDATGGRAKATYETWEDFSEFPKREFGCKRLSAVSPLLPHYIHTHTRG